MSERAAIFIAEWARDNLETGGFADGAAAREGLLADSHGLGMGLAEFEESVGPVDAFLQRAIDENWAERERRMRESGIADV